MDKVLILGGSGMLGHDLRQVMPRAEWTDSSVDITDGGAIATLIQDVRPDILINAAAYTNVDGAEKEPEMAKAINGDSLKHISKLCNDVSCRLIHISTDYVFDGRKGIYYEDDRPNPINEYGRSKLLGESNILKTANDFIIVRTSWLFGSYGKNFIQTMKRLDSELDEIKVVSDQFGSPTYTKDLSKAIFENITAESGIYHITNDGFCSWYDLAKRCSSKIIPCTSDEFVRPAERPKRSVLVNTKTPRLRLWEEAVTEFLDFNRKN